VTAPDAREPDAGALLRLIGEQTALLPVPLAPELRVFQATEITPLWQATEQTLASHGLPPPFWAFAWPGSQALARLILDRPELVRGRGVLDFGAGNGLAAIAAARVGAAPVVANDLDRVAALAQHLNARANRVALRSLIGDVVGRDLPGTGVVLAGDVCYEGPASRRIVAWLRERAAAGALVLLADPGRTYRPTDGLTELARYTVPTTRELEDGDSRETSVWRVSA
jgi:predicted nicotinamide N-methyase